MKPLHLLILVAVVAIMAYLLTLAIGSRTRSDEGPQGPERRSFDVDASYPLLGRIGRWFSPKMELPQAVYDLSGGQRVELSLPAEERRYRRLELTVTEPPVPSVTALTITYAPRTSGDEDYPDELTKTNSWPEEARDLPDATFLVLDGGGTLTVVNRSTRSVRIEVR